MLKFFRQYNKYILIFGAAFLMVAFLLQGTLDMFMGGGEAAQPVGEVNGSTVTVAQQRQAAGEMQLLAATSDALASLVNELADDPLQWMLMLEDARAMGLSASDSEVTIALESIGVTSEDLALVARRQGVQPATLRQAVRHWLILDQYRSIVLGHRYVSPLAKIGPRAQVINWQRSGAGAQWDYRRQMEMMQLEQALARVVPTPRLSEPLVAHFLHSQRAQASGRMVVLEADRYLEQVAPPSEDEIEALFAEYRDVLPGEGDYGFGYRYPARVKLEYLEIPIDAVRSQVTVDDADALTYYNQNPEQFREASDAEGEPTAKPYHEVRRQIIERLRNERARELAYEIAREAQNMLAAELRRLPREDRYYQLDESFTPMSLRAVADQIEQQFDVRPEVRQWTEGWTPFTYPFEELQSIPGLSQSRVAQRNIGFIDYLYSVRELEPPLEYPLRPLGLQAQAPSLPMVGFDGSHYLFRVTDAQPEHAPESLDEVRERVEADAWRKKAYEEVLLPAADEWLAQAREMNLATLAEQNEGLSVTAVPTISRRTVNRDMNTPGESLVVPWIEPVGQSESLVDSFFDLAEQVSDGGQKQLVAVPAAERIGSAPVPEKLSLAIFRVDTYQPMSQRAFQNQLGSPSVALDLTGALLRDNMPTVEVSRDALYRRVGFEPSTDEDEQPDLPVADPQQPRPGTF